MSSSQALPLTSPVKMPPLPLELSTSQSTVGPYKTSRLLTKLQGRTGWGKSAPSAEKGPSSKSSMPSLDVSRSVPALSGSSSASHQTQPQEYFIGSEQSRELQAAMGIGALYTPLEVLQAGGEEWRLGLGVALPRSGTARLTHPKSSDGAYCAKPTLFLYLTFVRSAGNCTFPPSTLSYRKESVSNPAVSQINWSLHLKDGHVPCSTPPFEAIEYHRFSH